MWSASIAFAVLLVVSVLLLVASSLLSGNLSVLALSPGTALNTLSNAAEVVAGVLAIAITVVAIVVELASTRYTHRITMLFVREPVNILVMSFFVITTVQCVWVAATLGGEAMAPGQVDSSPALLLTLGMVTVCLLALLPYFGFVLSFISPLNVIQRLQRNVTLQLRDITPGNVERRQADVLEAIEEIEDVARSAIEHSDRSIATGGINALAELMLDYVSVKPRLPKELLAVTDTIVRNTDFVSMSPMVIEDVHTSGSWVEVKIFRQYQTLFTSSLNRARDVCSLIALNTRRIAEHGVDGELDMLLGLTIRFFNSFLRAAINSGDLRTGYYLLNQYRLLAEGLLRRGLPRRVPEIAEHFRYYGTISYNKGQPFLLEAVAYDLTQLILCALDCGHGDVDLLLGLLLEVDRESKSDAQEESLLGVRRAQVQLAVRFLAAGEFERVDRICADLATESRHRLIEVRDELMAEDRLHFWEFTDRGINFAYTAPEHRRLLPKLFERLGIGAGDEIRVSVRIPRVATVDDEPI